MKREAVLAPAKPPRVRKVKRATISDDIVDQLMTLIQRGELKPGQRLPSERDLCIQFGAGRSSLREALRCLAIVGLLEARVGEGTSVAVNGGKFMGKIMEWRVMTEQQDLSNLLEVRLALESLTAAKAAVNAGPQEIATLNGYLEKMAAALKDHKRFSALDLEFHMAIARASHNDLLCDLIQMIRNQLAKGVARVLLIPDAIPSSLEEHRRIAAAIARHDADGARDAMQKHIEMAIVRYGGTRTPPALSRSK